MKLKQKIKTDPKHGDKKSNFDKYLLSQKSLNQID